MSKLKQSTNRIISFATVFALLTLLIFQSVSADSVELDKKYSGEELFAGLAFGQGEVGALFPEIWSSFGKDDLNSKEAQEASAAIIKEIKTIDPKFFTDLEDAIYSDDIHAIDKVMERGYVLLEDSIGKLDSQHNVDEVIGYCAVFVFVVTGAVGFNHQWVYNYEKFWDTSADASENQLAKEQFTVNIADRL